MSDNETKDETNPEDEKNFWVDRAKTGRAGCKKCKQKLETGALRIAKLAYNPFGAGKMKQWHHMDCILEVFKKQRPTTAKIEKVDDMGGWDDLTPEDQEEVMSRFPEINCVHLLKAQECQYYHRKKYHVSLNGNRTIVGIVSTRIKTDTKDRGPQPVPIKINTKDSLHRKRRESETSHDPGENNPDDKPSERTIKETSHDPGENNPDDKTSEQTMKETSHDPGENNPDDKTSEQTMKETSHDPGENNPDDKTSEQTMKETSHDPGENNPDDKTSEQTMKETSHDPGENNPDDKTSEQTIKETPKGNKWNAERRKAMSERMKQIWEKRKEAARKGKA